MAPYQIKIHGIRRLMFICLINTILGLSAKGQEINTTGNKFYTLFLAQGVGFERITICSEYETWGTAYSFKNGVLTPFSAKADSCLQLYYYPHTGVAGSWQFDTLAVMIETADPVTVYSSGGGFNSNNSLYSSLVYPYDALGDDYVITSFDTVAIPRSNFALSGANDSALIEITSPVPITMSPIQPGIPYTFWFDKGMTLAQENIKDCTGTRVRSLPVNGIKQRFSVFGGRTGAGGNIFYKRNVFYTMQVPVPQLGTRYHFVPHLTRKGDQLKIVGAHDSTLISVNGVPAFVVNKLQFVDTVLYTASVITSTLPVSVTQISRDIVADSVVNSLAFMYPLLDEAKAITRSVFASDRFTDSLGTISMRYLNLVCKTPYTTKVRLDGINKGSQFTPFPSDPAWSFAQLVISPGTHILEADSGVLAYYYSFGYQMGHGHLLGGNNKLLTGITTPVKSEGNIKVYPNPMNSTLWVQAAGLEQGNTLITVTDIQGREEYRHEAVFGSTNWQHEISTGHLARGVYFVRVQSGSSVKVLKVVKM